VAEVAAVDRDPAFQLAAQAVLAAAALVLQHPLRETLILAAPDLAAAAAA